MSKSYRLELADYPVIDARLGDAFRYEAGKLELEYQPFNLRQCLEEAIDIVAPHAADKALDLVYDIADNVPRVVLGDVARMRQILVNLVGNAVKFTAAGEVSLALTASPSRAGWADLHIAVTDTGVGVPPEKQQQIFAPFVQADGSTSRRYGGTGLGLAICSRLAELMQGRIWVQSRPGGGSVFHFTAPFGVPAKNAADFVNTGHLRGPLDGSMVPDRRRTTPFHRRQRQGDSRIPSG